MTIAEKLYQTEYLLESSDHLRWSSRVVPTQPARLRSASVRPSLPLSSTLFLRSAVSSKAKPENRPQTTGRRPGGSQ